MESRVDNSSGLNHYGRRERVSGVGDRNRDSFLGRLKRRPQQFARLLSDLTGRSHVELVAALVAQVDAAIDGARLAEDMIRQHVTPSDARKRMGVIEHEGDRRRGAVVESLARMLTTPIDREDVFRLSRAIDDVLDHLRDFVRESDLYALSDHSDFLAIIQVVTTGMRDLRKAVNSIGGDGRHISQKALLARKGANLVRRQYQEALAVLFYEEFDRNMLKRWELLRRIDAVGLRLGEAADMLADGALKRSI